MSKIKLGYLNNLKAEVKRFEKRVDEAIEALTEDKYSLKEFAAVKRGAMDLKQELTNATQFSKYETRVLKQQRSK